ncbi:acetolactate synthase large subunit [Kibdelosporangium aridum]|uniref:Acetolactate synthase large subunit n=1 Tax=Kibdelosporangium aridum TaxID=2030 RepID=A0A428XXF3_KIBAR|nr:acetolactate synthase large subunit [Kibdelosporangium aridum]RSM59944.1 acetolactate synthase large subunit [Kibdelosporangium aridum]
MNGAQALLRTLVDAGVNVCFGNPGTSEMHFVAALDSVPEMRGILGLFEGAVTGAADGYARMADKPAATLLHLGPGLANGLANLHNARRARTGIVNVVGDHATYHKQYDAPLESDIEALSTTVGWTRTSGSTEALATDAAEAVKAAQSGQIATLILPADVSWGDGGVAAAPLPPPVRPTVAENTVQAIVDVLKSGESTVILLGNVGTRERAIRAANRISQATGVKLFAETFPTRIERGAGVPALERLGYLAEQVTWQLTDVRHLVLAGAKSPVSFFAYPGKASDLVPDNCKVHVLAEPADDITAALEAVAEVVAPGVEPVVQEAKRPELPTGDLTPQNWVDVIGALLPENAVIVDESNTSGLLLPMATAGAPKHDVLTLTGGSIGFGLPNAVGAAVACPDRPIICLQADGSAMYTASALWTMAREGLNVTTVVLSNRSYAILKLELQRVGAESTGPKALDWLDLSRPDLDFVSLATGMGVPATRAATAEELADQFREAQAQPGPHVIEATIPTLF